MEDFLWLQNWLQNHGKSPWQFGRGIIFRTGEPSWHLSVDLEATELEDKDFQKFEIHRSVYNWVYCSIENMTFHGWGGPLNALESIKVFRKWAEPYTESNIPEVKTSDQTLNYFFSFQDDRKAERLLKRIVEAHHQLLGAVRPNLRAVTANVDVLSYGFSCNCYFDGEISQSDERVLEHNYTQFGNRFLGFHRAVTFYMQRLDAPQKIPQDHSFLYLRAGEEGAVNARDFLLRRQDIASLCKIPSAVTFHLLMQQALLGRITPHLRAVKADMREEERKLLFWFYFDQAVTEKEAQNVQEIIRQATFLGFTTEEHVVELAKELKIPNGGRFIYVRDESTPPPEAQPPAIPLFQLENYHITPPEQVDDDLAWLLAWYEISREKETSQDRVLCISLETGVSWSVKLRLPNQISPYLPEKNFFEAHGCKCWIEDNYFCATASLFNLADVFKVWRQWTSENPLIDVKYQALKAQCTISSDFGWFLRWIAAVPQEKREKTDVKILSFRGEIAFYVSFPDINTEISWLRTAEVYTPNDTFYYREASGFNAGSSLVHFFKILKACRIWIEYKIQPAFFSQNFDFRDNQLKNQDFAWLMKWYQYHCDDNWEHGVFGVVISSTQKPFGWLLDVDLRETELETCPFTPIDIRRSSTDWIQCEVRDQYFSASCSPQNLEEAFAQFRKWAEPVMNNSIEKTGIPIPT